MKTYHCVTQTFQDGGKIKTEITGTRKASRKPADTFKRTCLADIYSIWFDALEKASDFVANASDRVQFA